LIGPIPLTCGKHGSLCQRSTLPLVQEHPLTDSAAFDFNPTQSESLQQRRALRTRQRGVASWALQQRERLEHNALLSGEEAHRPLEVVLVQTSPGAAATNCRGNAGRGTCVELVTAARTVHWGVGEGLWISSSRRWFPRLLYVLPLQEMLGSIEPLFNLKEAAGHALERQRLRLLRRQHGRLARVRRVTSKEEDREPDCAGNEAGTKCPEDYLH